MKIPLPKSWTTPLAIAAVHTGSRAIFKTLKLQFHMQDDQSNPYLPETTRDNIYCVWHDELMFPSYGGSHLRTTALISQHRDGGFLAGLLHRLNVKAVRGSSSKGGAKAVRQLIEDTKNQHIVMTPDGPRGPEHVLKDGIVYIAAKTQKSVIPTAYAATSYWNIRGKWTGQIIPKPFATVHLVGTAPVIVPKKVDRESIAYYRDLIQTGMDEAQVLAKRLAGHPIPEHLLTTEPAETPLSKAA